MLWREHKLSKPSDVVLVSLASQQPTENWFVGESMGICYLASTLRAAGIKATLIDFGLMLAPKSSWVPIVNLKKPKIVGVSTNQATYSSAKDFITILRNSGYKGLIFMGGHYATLYAEQIANECVGLNAVVVGEAELSFKEIAIKALSDRDWRNHPAIVHHEKNRGEFMAQCNAPVPNINELPFPARDFLPIVLKRGGRAAVLTSRGCYANCSFCTIHDFYHSYSGQKLGWRGRTTESLIEEIAQVKKEYGVEFFTFTDDTFIGPGEIGRQRIFEFAQQLNKNKLGIKFIMLARANEIEKEIVSKLKEVGLQQVLIGIESFDESDLKFYEKATTPNINKRALDILSDLGVRYDMGMIMFHPKSQLSSIEKSYSEFKKYFPKNGGIFTSALNITTKLIIRDKTKITNKLAPAENRNAADFDGVYAFSDKHVACLAESMGFLFRNWLISIFTKKKYLEEAIPDKSKSLSRLTEATVASCIFDFFDQALLITKKGSFDLKSVLQEIDFSGITKNLQDIEQTLNEEIKGLNPKQIIDLFIFDNEEEIIVVQKNNPNYFKVDRVVAEYLTKKNKNQNLNIVREIDSWLRLLAEQQNERLLSMRIPEQCEAVL